jgi:hypothetical protein
MYRDSLKGYGGIQWPGWVVWVRRKGGWLAWMGEKKGWRHSWCYMENHVRSPVVLVLPKVEKKRGRVRLAEKKNLGKNDFFPTLHADFLMFRP